MNINIVDRKVVLPDYTICRLDKKAETLTFIMDKTINGKDLSLCNCFIKTLREDGFSDKVQLESTVNDNKISMSWQPSLNDTAVEGGLKCQISFEDSDNFLLNTEVFVLEIKESISGYECVESGYVPKENIFSNIMTKTDTIARFQNIENLITDETTTENKIANQTDIATAIINASVHYNDYQLSPLQRVTAHTYTYTLTSDTNQVSGKDYYSRSGEESNYEYTLEVSSSDYDSENLVDVSTFYERSVASTYYKYCPLSNHCYYISGTISNDFTLELPDNIDTSLMNEIYLEFTTGAVVAINWGEDRLFLNGEIPTIKANKSYEVLINYVTSCQKWCISVVENGAGE